MIIERLAKELGLKVSQVESTVKLIDDGNTIPFIARYRKEVTGNLSDVTLRDLDERLIYLRNLEARKEEVIRLITEQEKLTPELTEAILAAEVLQRVEDLYKPFKQKKSTRASKAKEKGLEPLAMMIWSQEPASDGAALESLAMAFINEEKGVKNIKEAVAGASDIIAEIISDDPEFTAQIREKTYQKGVLTCEAADAEESTVYEMYYNYSEPVSKMPDHRVLAINRGEKEKKLKVKLQTPVEEIHDTLKAQVIKDENSIFASQLQTTIEDAYKRLMAPSTDREIRNALTERAEKEAVKVFAKNTEKLLMAPPVKGARVIALDPGYRTGCKVTMLDETGKLLEHTVIYPVPPRNDVAGAKKTMLNLINNHGANVIAIGNGTASRETELFVSELIKESGKEVHYTIVNEAGASVYSASKLASEEYPDLDVTTRGALSIGRRLQDPLAELVKITPKSIGVGQYQHDVNQTMLDNALTNVVGDCVNRVGVDLNTASSALLQYIAGVNGGIAKNIVAYREENGVFKARTELKKVAKLGEKTYQQCVGFMRISEGKNPLDATAVHPESYKAAEQVLGILGIDKKQIAKGGAEQIEDKILELYKVEEPKKQTESHGQRIKGLQNMEALKQAMFANETKKEVPKEQRLKKSIEKMANEVGIGVITLSDIVAEMVRPGRDPREDMPNIIFRNDVVKFEDLMVGMEMMGTVRNVVDFGAFVDIGVKNDGLVHISEMSEKFIKHPMDAVSVGDTVKVRILSVDAPRQKVSLTMKLGEAKK